MTRKRILVTGAGGNASRNWIRCLKEFSTGDYYVIGVDTNAVQLEATHGCDVKVESPRLTDSAWAEKLMHIVKRNRVDFINFQTDRELARAINFDCFNPYIFLPSPETIRLCQDKLKTAVELGSDAPLSTPATEDFWRLFDKAWLRARTGAGSKAALPAQTWEIARAWMAYWNFKDGLLPEDFMISAYLPGDEYAHQSLWHNGVLLGCFLRRRIQYVFAGIMPSGQSSSPSVAESCRHTEAEKVAVAAVLKVSPCPNGVFGVDMKCDAAGIPKITEINAGRFYTTSDFSAAIGYNMVEAYTHLFFGSSPKLAAYAPSSYVWVRGMDQSPFCKCLV